MSSKPFVPLNPKPFLNSLTGKKVSVVLKWNMTYEGILEAVDSYMNLKVTEKNGYLFQRHMLLMIRM